MKKSLFAFLIILCSYIGHAQALQVQSNNKGLYVMHVISPKENFYSVGRMYNVTAKEIADFNALDMKNGLNVGQTIMIPLTKNNFSQKNAKGAPVYYTVGEKEGLYRVSLKNNQVLMASLRKWNNLKSDNIETGQNLIVGYLTAPDYHATAAPPATVKTTPVVTKEPEQKQQTIAATPKQQEVQKTETVSEPKTTVAVPVSKQQTQTAAGTGYFKSQYELQSKGNAAGKEATVTAGIFKTASGWQDAKYYALLDKVEPGTIVQVINPSNNKTIYAKVLGEMGGIRQNQGLQLRISSAAASALEINDTEKFIVHLQY